MQVFEIEVSGKEIKDVNEFVSKVKTSKMMKNVQFDVDNNTKSALITGVFTEFKKGDACVKLCNLSEKYNVNVPRWVRYYSYVRIKDLAKMKAKAKAKAKATAKAVVKKQQPVAKSPALLAKKPTVLARIIFLLTGKS